MSLKKNIIANYIGQFYTIFIGIIMLPFYLNYLGAEAYGLVGFFTMLVLWMMLFDMGFSQTLARETAKLKDKAKGLMEIKQTLRSVEAMISILSLIIFLGIFFGSGWISQNWLQIHELSFETVEYSVKLMGFMIAIRWYVSLYTGVVIGLEQQVWLNIYKSIIATLRFAGALVLVVYISDDIFHFFIYQFFVAILEFIILKYKIYKELPISEFIVPTVDSIKKIAPFALSIAYTSGAWIVFTQLDKLLLSHYLPLNEYGYFALVVAVSSAVLQIASPLSQAILPRMTLLLSNNKENEMLVLYKKGTQFMSILIFSVVGIISFFSYELLFAWTGDIKASRWASPILFWYILGNGILAILAFQYYLQYAHGVLKYHIRFNMVFPLAALPFMSFAVMNYGAVGAGITWFFIQLIIFLIWPPFIHNKFAEGIHKNWMIKDIFPSFIVTSSYLLILKQIDIDFELFTRLELLFCLIGLGIILLIFNSLIYSSVRKKLKGIVSV